MNVCNWPFFTVKEVLNVVESNFRFVPESGHSLTVNMHADAYI